MARSGQLIALHMSAFGGKADIGQACRFVCLWLKPDILIAVPIARPLQHCRDLPVHSAQRRTQAANL
jgi:hypothetical protein